MRRFFVRKRYHGILALFAFYQNTKYRLSLSLSDTHIQKMQSLAAMDVTGEFNLLLGSGSVVGKHIRLV